MIFNGYAEGDKVTPQTRVDLIAVPKPASVFKCGDLAHGFARVRCPDCRHEFLLAFSCRGRWFRSTPQGGIELNLASLAYLKLWETPSVSERAPPARVDLLPGYEPEPIDKITYELFDDGWPQYEEPFITVN